MKRPILCTFVLALGLTATARAHGGVDHGSLRLTPAEAWNTVTGLVLIALLSTYVIGVWRLWESEAGKATVPMWRAAAFTGGCASAAIALLSPLDRWSDILFSAHMAQHEVLMLVAAPLMVLGRPFVVTLWGMPPEWRGHVAAIARRESVSHAWGVVSGPLTVLVLHAVVLWAWHVPVLFEAAFRSESLHVVQHLGFFLTAALFWWALIHGRYGRIGYGVGVMYVFATAMNTEILGALLTFRSRTWYPTHAVRTAARGIDPVTDQQLAGVLMWIPFGAVFVLIGLALFAAWLGEAERRVAFTSSERALRQGHVLGMFVVILWFTSCHRADQATAHTLTGGDAARGRAAIERYGCGTCHEVPGVSGARGLVGPPLSDIADRSYLAGQLPNNPDNMMLWIRRPQDVEKGTAMPNLGVGVDDARDIAAYLYTLRR